MHTAESIVKESIELISLPDVYVRLRDVISSQNSSMSDVAQIIAHDPAITARLLKLVNSPFFGLAANAVTARFIAYQCGNIDTERPFIAGLLHNIGHLLSYQVMPTESRASLELANLKNIPLYLAERELLGFDYAEIGSKLMREWHLPESLQHITECHVEPVRASDFRLETAIIHVSSVLSRLVVTETPVSPDTLCIDPVCWALTELTVDDMADIKKEVDQQASMVMSMLFTHTKSA